MKTKYKFYLFYLKEKYKDLYPIYTDNNGLYAYTDDKNIKKAFCELRDMNIFCCRKVYLCSDERRYLLNVYHKNSLIIYCFNGGLAIPITNLEKLNIEGYGNKIILRANCLVMSVHPNIFYGKDNSKLMDGGYGMMFEYFMAGGMISEFFKPDFLKIFIRLYGKTIKLE